MYVVVSAHSSYGDGSLPIGVYETLDAAQKAVENKYPDIVWDDDFDGVASIKLTGCFAVADYIDIVEVPYQDLAERE